MLHAAKIQICWVHHSCRAFGFTLFAFCRSLFYWSFCCAAHVLCSLCVLGRSLSSLVLALSIPLFRVFFLAPIAGSSYHCAAVARRLQVLSLSNTISTHATEVWLRQLAHSTSAWTTTQNCSCSCCSNKNTHMCVCACVYACISVSTCK